MAPFCTISPQCLIQLRRQMGLQAPGQGRLLHCICQCRCYHSLTLFPNILSPMHDPITAATRFPPFSHRPNRSAPPACYLFRKSPCIDHLSEILPAYQQHHSRTGTAIGCYCCCRYALQTAIIWEADEPGTHVELSYNQLLQEVCRVANVLKSLGVKKGDVSEFLY